MSSPRFDYSFLRLAGARVRMRLDEQDRASDGRFGTVAGQHSGPKEKQTKGRKKAAAPDEPRAALRSAVDAFKADPSDENRAALASAREALGGSSESGPSASEAHAADTSAAVRAFGAETKAFGRALAQQTKAENKAFIAQAVREHTDLVEALDAFDGEDFAGELSDRITDGFIPQQTYDFDAPPPKIDFSDPTWAKRFEAPTAGGTVSSARQWEENYLEPAGLDRAQFSDRAEFATPDADSEDLPARATARDKALASAREELIKLQERAAQDNTNLRSAALADTLRFAKARVAWLKKQAE